MLETEIDSLQTEREMLQTEREMLGTAKEADRGQSFDFSDEKKA
jgi:hypothetical protein